MGELNFTPAGRIDPSAFAGGKLLVETTVLVDDDHKPTVYFNDNVSNYDVLFLLLDAGGYTGRIVVGDLGRWECSNGGMQILVKLKNNRWTMMGRNNTGSSSDVWMSNVYFTGNSLTLSPYGTVSGNSPNVSVKLYGLKLT